MSDITITPTQITLATTDTPAMVQFYSSLFSLTLQPTPLHGTTLYRGTLHAIPFVLCPNELAGVQASQSRHQFTYTVSDLRATLERALAAGGAVQEVAPAEDNPTTAVILDPDGNSLVFVQRADVLTPGGDV